MPKIVDHELRRRQLVEASWDVMAAEGLDGVTLRKVADAAQCTTGRIAHYFSSRDELILSALRAAHGDAARRMSRIAEFESDPAERLTRVVHEGLPLDSARLREWRVWIVFWAAAASNAQLADENRRRYDAWQALIASLLVAMVGKADAATRALELVSLIDGLGIRATLTPTAASRCATRDAIDRWVAGL